MMAEIISVSQNNSILECGFHLFWMIMLEVEVSIYMSWRKACVTCPMHVAGQVCLNIKGDRSMNNINYKHSLTNFALHINHCYTSTTVSDSIITLASYMP